MNNPLRLSVDPALFPVTYTNGPGLRYVMWTQGCSIRCCTNCLNPELRDPTNGAAVDIDQVLSHVDKLKESMPIEGITILGGEPTDQAAALSQLLPGIQKQNLTVMLYTGHGIETLLKQGRYEEISHVLQSVDILVEGRYNPRADFPGTLWRGSVNQRILLLSAGYDIPRLKTILQTTAKRIARKIDIIRYYNGNRLIRKHWFEALPREQASRRKDLLPQQNEITEIPHSGGRIVSWLPELAGSPPEGSVFLSPKGITGVLEPDNRIHLFGFQKEAVVEQFKKALQTQGIRLNPAARKTGSSNHE